MVSGQVGEPRMPTGVRLAWWRTVGGAISAVRACCVLPWRFTMALRAASRPTKRLALGLWPRGGPRPRGWHGGWAGLWILAMSAGRWPGVEQAAAEDPEWARGLLGKGADPGAPLIWAGGCLDSAFHAAAGDLDERLVGMFCENWSGRGGLPLDGWGLTPLFRARACYVRVSDPEKQALIGEKAARCAYAMCAKPEWAGQSCGVFAGAPPWLAGLFDGHADLDAALTFSGLHSADGGLPVRTELIVRTDPWKELRMRTWGMALDIKAVDHALHEMCDGSSKGGLVESEVYGWAMAAFESLPEAERFAAWEDCQARVSAYAQMLWLVDQEWRKSTHGMGQAKRGREVEEGLAASPLAAKAEEWRALAEAGEISAGLDGRGAGAEPKARRL